MCRATSGTWSTARCSGPGRRSASTRPGGCGWSAATPSRTGAASAPPRRRSSPESLRHKDFTPLRRTVPTTTWPGSTGPSPTTWPVPSRATPTTPRPASTAALTVSWSDDDVPGRVHSVQLDVHPDVVPVVLVPAAQLSTATARAVLPERVAHAQAALNSGRSALLVEAAEPPARPAAAGHPRVAAPGAAARVLPAHDGAGRPAARPRPRRGRVRRRAERARAGHTGQRPGGACPGRHGGVARARTGNDLPRRERSTCYIEGAAGGDRRGSCDIASAALTTTKRNVPLRTPHCAALVVLSWSGSS